MIPLKIVKRDDLPRNKAILIRTLSVALSIVFAGLVIALLGYNPIIVFTSMVKGALGTTIRIQQTTLKAIPLLITSLGILVAFKNEVLEYRRRGADYDGGICRYCGCP